MNGLFFLLCCTEILSALLCGATTGHNTTDEHTSSPSTTPSLIDQTTFPASKSSIAMSSAWPTTKVTSTSKSPATSPRLVPPPKGFQNIFLCEGCLPLLMVTGGLMVVCTILLVSTLLLACKVCHLSRRIRGLSSNSDLVSNTEYWMGTDKKGKSKSEAEPKETTVLMADINETPAETGNGTKEEGGKVAEEGQTGEESKGEAGGAEEASAKPVADADKSSPSEEAADSQTTKAATASTSEGTEEPKDVV